MGEWCYIQNGRQPGPVPWYISSQASRLLWIP